jgi:hypothetical protein
MISATTYSTGRRRAFQGKASGLKGKPGQRLYNRPTYPTTDQARKGLSVFSCRRNVNPTEEVTMKKYFACAAIATLFAGCSSALSLRDSAPTATYAGNGSAEAVADCVVNAWSEKSLNLQRIVLYSGTTVEIRETADSPVIALVDIKPVGANTIAKYFSHFPTDDSWFFDHVETCMNATPPEG